MEKSKHTKEPWRFKSWNHDKVVDFIIPEFQLIDDDGVKNLANAQRIVDCVNACEGINPKAISDLLTAARLLLICNWEYEPVLEERKKQLQAAITKAEGTKL